MNERKKAYGVFLVKGNEKTLIFSDVMSYAIYEREDQGDTFKREMERRWPETIYETQAMNIEAIKNE